MCTFDDPSLGFSDTILQNEIHVWRASLDRSLSVVYQLQQVLTPQEHATAQRFHFEEDRRHWAVARGLLRMLLSHYTHIQPRLISFELNRYGKPSLAPAVSPFPLQFNLSHSGKLALYAFALCRPLGIDVEYMHTNIEYDEIAARYFSPSEQAALRSLPPAQKRSAFYNCWTRKEAYIKARGMGLSLPLDLFAVSLLPDEPVALLQSGEDPLEVQRWSMQALDPGINYAGTLVVEGADWQLHCWQWADSLLFV